jgi:hypothetical protein
MLASIVANNARQVHVLCCPPFCTTDGSLGVDSSALSSLAALAMTSASHGSVDHFLRLSKGLVYMSVFMDVCWGLALANQ